MTSNLLVSHLNKQKNQTIDYSQNSKFDNSVVDGKNLIHAQRPVGQLVSSNIFTAPVRFVSDLCADTVSLTNAIKTGKSDDYKLGRVNDLTMKLGSLGIAGYLFTKRPQTTQKYMELIGFGSFFASMALWPKLFIQLPAKLIHGIDVFQEYKDSQGRQKRFFLDPQYTPWDIITPAQMDKLGDKLNIPRNVKNRSDLTKEKMHKIALQSNTMWTLSAGFGVPVMSAFICSGIERLLPKPILDKKLSYSNDKIQKLLKTDLKDIKPDSEIISGFKEFMKANKTSAVTDEFMSKFAKAITGSDKFADTLIEDMKSNSLFNGSRKISDGTIDKMFTVFETDFQELGITKDKFLANFKRDVPESKQGLSLLKALEQSASSPRKINRPAIKSFLNSNPMEGMPLSEQAIKKAEVLNGIFAKFSTIEKSVVDNLLLKSGQSAEAIATKSWLDFSKALTKVVALSPDEIKTFSSSNSEAKKILNKKFENSLKSESGYEQQFSSLFNLFSDFCDKFYTKGTSSLQEEKNNIFALFEKPVAKLKSEGFERLANDIIFTNKDSVTPSYTKSLISELIDLPVTAKRSAFARNLLTLDFYKRKVDGELPTQIEQIAKTLGVSISGEEITAYQNEAERILLDADLGRFITRLNHQGESKIKYNVIMDLLYNPKNLSSKTTKIISKGKNNNFAVNLFKTFLTDMKDVIGHLDNPHFPSLNNNSVRLQPLIHDVMIGDNMISMLNKTYETANNTKIWNKKFAILGISVAAITVLSQLFFGKIDKINTESQNSKEAA